MKKFLTISTLAVLLASVGGPVVLANDGADSASAGIPIVQIPFTFTNDGTFDTTGMVTTVSAVMDGINTSHASSVGFVTNTTTGIGRGRSFTETAYTQFVRLGNRPAW